MLVVCRFRTIDRGEATSRGHCIFAMILNECGYFIAHMRVAMRMHACLMHGKDTSEYRPCFALRRLSFKPRTAEQTDRGR